MFDCWFESGSMPYASRHYPFENKELVERSFPADIIAEGLDQTMKDLILEELNVREMKFLEDETKLVKLSAKPNFLAIKAKGPDYAKNMKVISAKLNRIVADGMAVEANQHFTVALDLKITDELRRACVARELVNRIQNRRKDQNYAITDKIEVTLFSASDVFKQAVAENEAYIAGETQAVAIKWAAAADGLEANDADGEAFSFTTVRA